MFVDVGIGGAVAGAVGLSVLMLDHAGEALVVLAGFWRFVLSGMYRQRKIEEWRGLSGSVGGCLAVAAEMLVGVVIGLGLPGAIILVVAAVLGVL